ncbi:ATP-binding cassette domain-containing protein [Agrobacterium vitis]|nr:ATP-binding cassette domain-containing protein [Allorhizobium ampelinum]MCM2450252.1 ATP-binding cassette domain-containing protein [Agrobacterium vitis]MCM2471245.1 ATP-binding cassette domain-containing protein [Agrobacterium vitis]MVA52785.1 ATP-binding cassette domain-containing protein [Agrobacterium vitis]
MSPVILMQGVNHWFGDGEARVQVLFDVSLSIQRGSFTVLRGPSGSGKTTLLTLMGCLRTVQDGSIMLLGEELGQARPSRQAELRRRLGFIFQAHNLHESLTARQNTLMGLQVHGTGGNSTKQNVAAIHMLDLLGLGDRVNYLPEKLSGGQKQRVAIARALVSNPEIVFADEPTAALDKDASLYVVRMLKALGDARGISTVMVTHDTRIVDLADRIITIEDGRIINDLDEVPKEEAGKVSAGLCTMPQDFDGFGRSPT